jgi:pimeloyl-ACP methyl ester carboxylesterase
MTSSVVLVHGLSGDYIETWKAEDETVWPRDLLPVELGTIGIRVLSFEYSGSIRSSSSTAGVNDAAQNLLHYLDNERDDPRSKRRPIVFVGHSLGGVIIKRVIAVSEISNNYALAIL